MSDEELADLFSALGDVRRVRALRYIVRNGCAPFGGDEDAVCACHVQDHLDLSQPATSYHMKVLRQAGWVAAEKRGRWVHYRLSEEGLSALRAFVAELEEAAPALSGGGA